jgi:hypothetical protein
MHMRAPEEKRHPEGEGMGKAKGESRKPDTEAEGLAWCLALHRKRENKRKTQAQEVRRADHR